MYKDYITRKKLPFTFDQMADVPHEEMNLVYNKADVNICTAMAGGFEMSINEAGACRVPSLCTDWTFMNENVLHEKSGILIPVSDYTHPPSPDPREFRTSDIAQDRVWGEISVDSLSTYMLWCYNNIKHVRHMGGYAREHIKENFSWKKIADRLGDEISES
jgi:glycosyltransferase involved in cell wall biosynthesis